MVYALLFRLAIIAVGALAIFCGYRLFCLPLGGGGDTELTAKLGEHEFALKRAAPGTFFVLFGVVVVGLMVYQGNPELLIEEFPMAPVTGPVVNPVSATADGAHQAGVIGSAIVASRIQVKSSQQAMGVQEVEARLQQAAAWYVNGQRERAISEFHELLRMPDLPMIMAAYPLNALAWDALQQGEHERALAYAVLAVEIEPDNEDFVDTLLQSHQQLPGDTSVTRLLARLQAGGMQQQAARLQQKLQAL